MYQIDVAGLYSLKGRSARAWAAWERDRSERSEEMKTASNENAGLAPCPRPRRLRRPMNQVLHQQRRAASVLSVAALVVTLEKEWNGVDVSVMRVRIEQLPALRAALGEYGKL